MHRIQSSRGTGAGDWSRVLHSLYFASSAGSLSWSATDRNCAGQSRSPPTSPHAIIAATSALVMGLILNRDELFIGWPVPAKPSTMGLEDYLILSGCIRP